MSLETVKARLIESGVKDVNDKEIQDRLDLLMLTYRVPEAEADRSVLNSLAKRHGVQIVGNNTKEVQIKDISKAGEWVTIKGKVVEIWKDNPDAVAQSGLIADGTGATKFTVFKKSNLKTILEYGKSYQILGCVTDEFRGQFSIKLQKNTRIVELDVPIEAVAPERVTPDAKLKDIKNGMWCNVVAKVLQLWDSKSDAVWQVGLLGDETGTMKFISWSSAELPEVEIGKSYIFRNAVASEYNGKLEVGFNKKTTIEETDNVEVKDQTITITAPIVHLLNNSGLVKRCPECNAILKAGSCEKHGKIKGVYDLRALAIFDDGRESYTLSVGKEVLEPIVGFNLETAIEMAMAEMDAEVVAGAVEVALVGKYWEVTGSQIDNLIVAKVMKEATFKSEMVADAATV